MPCTNPLTQGLYVLYHDQDHALDSNYEYFVGCFMECFRRNRAVKFARRYGALSGEVTFTWPDDDHIELVENEVLERDAIVLPHPNTTRRGSVKFPQCFFRDIAMSSIQ